MLRSRAVRKLPIPNSVLTSMAERSLNRRFDHATYGLKPKHRITSQHPTVNDELPNRIICGSIIIKPNIKGLTKTGVEFVDGTFEDNIDAVIYATGYIFGFPFIDEDIIKVEKNRVRLFKYVFPPEVQPATLAIIGCFQPVGALMPLSEIQCRWATRVFKVRKSSVWPALLASLPIRGILSLSAIQHVFTAAGLTVVVNQRNCFHLSPIMRKCSML